MIDMSSIFPIQKSQTGWGHMVKRVPKICIQVVDRVKTVVLIKDGVTSRES